MKVLLDENMPHALREWLEEHGHKAFTAAWMKWVGIKNGRLLRLAADEGFDVMVTLDAGIEHEQDRATLPVAVVIQHLPNEDADELALLFRPLLNALASLQPRTIVHVEKWRP